MNWNFLSWDESDLCCFKKAVPHPGGPAPEAEPSRTRSVCVCVNACGQFSATFCSSSRHLPQKKSVWAREWTLKTAVYSPSFSHEQLGRVQVLKLGPPSGPKPGFCLTNTHNKSLLERHFYCSFPLVPFLEFEFLLQQERGNRPDTLKTDTAGLDISGYTPETLVLVCVSSTAASRLSCSLASRIMNRRARWKRLKCHKVTLILKKTNKNKPEVLMATCAGITGVGKTHTWRCRQTHKRARILLCDLIAIRQGSGGSLLPASVTSNRSQRLYSRAQRPVTQRHLRSTLHGYLKEISSLPSLSTNTTTWSLSGRVRVTGSKARARIFTQIAWLINEKKNITISIDTLENRGACEGSSACSLTFS